MKLCRFCVSFKILETTDALHIEGYLCYWPANASLCVNMEPPITQHNVCVGVLKWNDLLGAHGRLWSPCFHQLAGNVAQSWCITFSMRSPISSLDLQWYETKWLVTINICVLPHTIELTLEKPQASQNEISRLLKCPSKTFPCPASYRGKHSCNWMTFLE